MIGIINYGSGNIAALMNIFKQKKIAHYLASSAKDLKQADRYLLPGVGAFDPTMEQLTESGLFEALKEQVFGPKKKPILGICVGMQLLAEGSEEGNRPGLGWIKGQVRRIDAGKLNTLPHLPHMGWNGVRSRGKARLLQGIDAEKGFYFLHSYYFDAADATDVAATVSYGGDLVCAVEREHVFGVQFHPEKSHSNGVTVLTNFAGVA
jgi:imidazole glycerol-phosphate synthase subunit HisH